MPVVASLSPIASGVLIALFTSALAWLVGTQVSYVWDERKRRRADDLAALEAFYRTYGDFFATWKLWSAYKRHGTTSAPPSNIQWTLLERATAAEGGFEALLVKIASERTLDDPEKELLACFREGYQQLREKIREDLPLTWGSHGGSREAREYRAFKGLAEYVAFMLETDERHRVETTALARYFNAIGLTRRKEDANQQRQTAITNLLAITTRENIHGSWWLIAEGKLSLDEGPAEPSHDGASQTTTNPPGPAPHASP